MESNPEQRDDTRFSHRVAVLVENYQERRYYEGKMVNYSRTGLYFETDFAPEPGSELFIGIEDSPYSSCHDVLRAKVMWCKELSDGESFYYYGVGVKFY